MNSLNHKLFGRIILIASVGSGLFTSCLDDNNEAGLKRQLTIAEAKLSLANSMDENNLITRIEKGSQGHTVYFESGNLIALSNIERVDYDSALWLATFQFQDKSSQAAYFIGALNFDKSAIILNPYLTSPLTALAHVKTPVKGKFKVIVKGKPSGGVAMEKTFSHFGEFHELPILGLYEDYPNQVEFIFMNGDDQVRCTKLFTITTPQIQNKPALDIEILNNQLTETYKGLYIISNLKLGFDQTGETRWYYNGDGASFYGKLRNGNFIVSEPGNLNFYEVTMLGQRVKKYNVPNALHHEIVEMPEGNFMVASHSPPGAPYEDVVAEVDRTSGTVIKSWDFNTILDPLRTPLPDTQAGDWLHINALYYDETDNSIVISGRSQCAVIKIDYATGSIRWILGNHNGWSESFAPFLLKPVDNEGNEIMVTGTDFWNYGQHAVQRLPNGNLLLYDNGDYRGFYDDPNVPQASYTRVAEYKINEMEKTVELVWQFDHNKSVFTKYTGYTQHLGNTRLAAFMWMSEATPKIIEIDTDDQVVFEATVNRGKNSYYRTIKTDLYAGID